MVFHGRGLQVVAFGSRPAASGGNIRSGHYEEEQKNVCYFFASPL